MTRKPKSSYQQKREVDDEFVKLLEKEEDQEDVVEAVSDAFAQELEGIMGDKYRRRDSGQ